MSIIKISNQTKHLLSNDSTNLKTPEEEPAPHAPHDLQTAPGHQACSLDHPVYVHPPSPHGCGRVCVHKLCVSSVYTLWFVGRPLIRATLNLRCDAARQPAGMCLDFWVWSSTSRSASHALSLLAPAYLGVFWSVWSCVGKATTAGRSAAASARLVAAESAGRNLKRLGGISGCVGVDEWAQNVYVWMAEGGDEAGGWV